MKELLSEIGSIYVHVDWHIGHYVKILLDEIFGKNNFINEIVWGYKDIGSRAVQYFKRKHDVIYLYQKLIVEYLTYKDSNCLKVQCSVLVLILMKMVILHIDG